MKRTTAAATTVVALALSACTPSGDPLAPRGSSDLISSEDGRSLFVADADNGRVARVDTTTGDLTTLVAGLEPTRLARIGDRIFVSLRGQGEVLELADTPEGLVEVARVAVGPEPYGLVASPDGTRLYVAVSLADEVLALDAEGLGVVERWTVPGEPRWLTAHPAGRYVYVACGNANAPNANEAPPASAGGRDPGVLWQIDTQEGVVEQVPLPDRDREVPSNENPDGSSETVPLEPRVTGDPDIDPRGDYLVVPGLYVDHDTPVTGVDDPSVVEGGGGGYASGNVAGLTRFNPAVVVFELDLHGAVKDPANASTLLVAGLPERSVDDQRFDTGFFEERGFDEDFAFEGRGRFVRGYLSSLRFSPDGHAIYASLEGDDVVVVVPREPFQVGRPFVPSFGQGHFVDEAIFFDEFGFGLGGFTSVPLAFLDVAEGPTGLALGPEHEVLTWSRFDRALHSVPRGEVDALFDGQADGDFGFNRAEGKLIGQLGASALDPDVESGRRLFYSNQHESMASAGAGVSCATCHFEGRNDGLTWQFDIGPRQTPSLAGAVSETAPVTWTSDVATVADEVFLTSQGRMGGHGISTGEMVDVAAFIDATRAPILRTDVDVDAVARGRAIFEREDVACASCHSGTRYTDNQSYPMHGLAAVNTPALTGLVTTAPYLHDGAARSLRALVDMADDIGMGHTAQLSDAEKADLVTFLRTL